MLLIKGWAADPNELMLPADKQVRAWQRADRKMNWGIPATEFDEIAPMPQLSPEEIEEGFIGAVLSYGFGNDGHGNADSVLSAQRGWEYARKNIFRRTWQCEYVDFKKPENIRLRPGARPRLRGFYYAKFKPDKQKQPRTVSQIRKSLKNKDTGLGPEGFQLLAVTHTHFQKLMNNREMPFMVMADLDVAPHGFSDFYDAPQMFCSNNTLGLGIGNIDNRYPNFGIPTIRL